MTIEENKDKNRMKELITILDKAAKAYYVDGAEIMSNYEYDALYDELESLEGKLGLKMSDSPTNKVGYEVLSKLPKEKHSSLMLSLNKTKSPEELLSFLGEQKGLLSWKMDGLTIVLTYDDGRLTKAVTRGNGEVGEIVTANAKVFKGLPLSIAYKGHLVIRGEAVIHYSDFNKINAQIPEMDAKYKNPRNLCSGSVRQLDTEVTAKRSVRFYAFSLVEAEGVDFKNSRKAQLDWLNEEGFTCVAYKEVDANILFSEIKEFEKEVLTNDFPSDGLVLLFDDIGYGNMLGATSKFPRDAMAFKWKDDLAKTRLRAIEWSASRTGLINPVAIFDTVELEGTNVSRASLHNLSYIKSLKLGIGDEIEVFKANMIIPQIASNITKSDNVEIPSHCPVCSAPTIIEGEEEVQTLYCSNAACPAKHIKRFVHFASRDAMKIEGFSEATVDKFIQEHFIKRLPDIYHLTEYKDKIVALDGFGIKSYSKLMEAIETSRHTYLYKLFYGLGIAGIGLANAKMISKKFTSPELLAKASIAALIEVDGVGEILAEAVVNYFSNKNNREEFFDLVSLLDLQKEEKVDFDLIFENKSFVVTGTLNNYENRNQLKNLIERLGGKVSSSVSANTAYLINNDITSNSSKNKKAKEVGIPIITEEDFDNILRDNNIVKEEVML